MLVSNLVTLHPFEGMSQCIIKAVRQALSADVDNADDEWEGVKQTTSIYSRLQNLRQNLRFTSNKVKSIILPSGETLGSITSRC